LRNRRPAPALVLEPLLGLGRRLVGPGAQGFRDDYFQHRWAVVLDLEMGAVLVVLDRAGSEVRAGPEQRILDLEVLVIV
jgi:hypothetical protein